MMVLLAAFGPKSVSGPDIDISSAMKGLIRGLLALGTLSQLVWIEKDNVKHTFSHRFSR